MPIDFTLTIRREVIALLKADVAVSAIVADRIHDEPPANVVWPFIRWGLPLRRAYEATCLEGSEIDVTLHAFDKSKGSGRIDNLVAAIERALDNYEPSALSLIDRQWVNTQVIPDGQETSAHHGIVQFKIVVAEKQELTVP